MSGARNLNLEIDYRHEKAGWIDCFLTFDGVRHNLWASDVYPPFPQLLHFMRALAADRLPYRFYWDEEGHGAHFEAWPVAEGSPNFHFKIRYDIDNSTWVDAELERKAVVDVFLAALKDFALYARSPSRLEWGCSLVEIIAFEEFQRRAIPPRSDVHSAEPIDLSIRRTRHLRLACQWIYISVWGIPVGTLALPDSHPAWSAWFDWLEKILSGQFPAEVFFINQTVEILYQEFLEAGEPGESVFEKPWGLTFHATAVDHPRHFRLVITAADGGYRGFLQLDEVQDRRTFVAAFCAKFERMLAEDYELLPCDDGTLCDLHDLPLARLQALLARPLPGEADDD